MKKTEALRLLGGTVTSAAQAIGIKPPSVSEWPEDLPPRIADRVYAALARQPAQTSAIDFSGFDEAHICLGQAVSCIQGVATDNDPEADATKEALISLMLAVGDHIEDICEDEGASAAQLHHAIGALTALHWSLDRYATGVGCSDQLSFAALNLLGLAHLSLRQRLALLAPGKPVPVLDMKEGCITTTKQKHEEVPA